MGKLLARDEILSVQDLPVERVEVPEWGGDVLMRGLTAAERDAFEQSVIEMQGKSAKVKMQNLRAKLVALSIVDEDGNRLFTQADAEALGKKSGAVMSRLFEVAQRLSGMGDKDVEELVGNFAETQPGDSSSE